MRRTAVHVHVHVNDHVNVNVNVNDLGHVARGGLVQPSVALGVDCECFELADCLVDVDVDVDVVVDGDGDVNGR